jgi:hypothetical protein
MGGERRLLVSRGQEPRGGILPDRLEESVALAVESDE